MERETCHLVRLNRPTQGQEVIFRPQSDQIRDCETEGVDETEFVRGFALVLVGLRPVEALDEDPDGGDVLRAEV